MTNFSKIISFEKIKKRISYPDFLNIQISSFKNFISYDYKKKTQKYKNDGLTRIFKEYLTIKNYKNHLNFSFQGYYLSTPIHSPEYCLERGLTYSIPLKAKFKLFFYKKLYNKKITKTFFLCNIPYMTPNGSFIFNGYERVIVAQIIKAPGVFFGESSLLNGSKYYYGKIIPQKGIWIEITADNNDLLNVILDVKKKFYLTTFLRAIGYSHDEDLLNLFKLSKTIFLKKENEKYLLGKILAGKVLTFWFEDFVDEKSGEILTLERNSIILDRNTRITKKTINKLKKNQLTKVLIKQKQDYTNEYSLIYNTLKRDPTNSQEEALVYIFQQLKNKNPRDKLSIEQLITELIFSIKYFSLSQFGRMKLNKLHFSPKKILTLTLTYEDILAVIENLVALYNSKKGIDELEHLSNKIVNTIEEQLYAQYSLGISKILAYLKEKLKQNLKKNANIKTILKNVNPKKLIQAKYLNNVLNTYFGTNPLSQFMDQMNPLSELTHKRRLSYLGTGGLSRERAGYEIRDINYSYYGRLCPIETPEGPNIGLISSLCVFGKVNSMGNLITPYFKIKKGKIINKLIYLSSDEEMGKNICQLYKNHFFYSSKNKICRINSDYQMINNENIDFMDVACNQMASISVSLIPYLEHDDANRALMGSNMMRQAVPLLNPDLPIVYTGMEKDMIKYTRNIIYSKSNGIVKYVDSKKIIIQNSKKKLFQNNIIIHYLPKFQTTNQNTCFTLNPIVKIGDKIKKGQVISEGFATKKGELALGKNIKVAFMPFKGYNFEDAIVVSEKIIKQDYFTSIKILKLTIEARKTKSSKEKFTNQIPNLSKKEIKTLDKKGIVKIGTFITPGRIIVGKISQNTDPQIKPEKKFLTAILGEKNFNIKDRSVRAGPSIKGIVIRRSIFKKDKKNHQTIFSFKKNKRRLYLNNQIKYIKNLLKKKVKIIKRKIIKIIRIPKLRIRILKNVLNDFKKEKRRLKTLYLQMKQNIISGDPIPHGVYKLVKLYIAEKRNLKVGDKMSGRHGNKGVVAKIAKEEDMPYLADGSIIDMVLNPLGVPSRMNLGQIYESITGDIGYKLKKRFKTPIFNGGTMKELLKYGKKAKIPKLGKTYLYNGETGEKFKNPSTVGILYMLKLGHMVDDKLHARSIGPYSLITQQPLGGKSQYGGQRFGEMEVWALEAFGASNILQELLTIKSDDIKGRIKTYESIVKGLKLPKPKTPAALSVLKNELKGLCINLKLTK
ncbi:DNA-directed RNA polymerase subunit beta [Candidatus Karelsulcia muelleri]|uniref:DNA-directed RNA polymerase subunit beta n=1 Tax=Candidatus Karelsulcia muelleri TaxID=336810 RepID=UPI001FF36822|nr:DNA-directed RNA polymerase subunit beta [Candidatus Karelsulcia muelleri]UOQ32954.1 DNA-directed RNA polymerase subunit beta [Candidatus Karelsulcia muelleri]